MVSYLQSNIHNNIKKNKKKISHPIGNNSNIKRNNYVHPNQENMLVVNNPSVKSSMKIKAKDTSGNS